MNASNYFLSASTEEGEIQRLDVQHQVWQILLNGRLLIAPHSRIKSLLDLGCGSALWTAVVARHLPQAEATGVDITPPANCFGVKNLTLIEADVEKLPWDPAVADRGPFDIITLRVLVSAIGDWPSLIERCYDHLKPGGWVEIHDITIGTFSDTQDWKDQSSPLMRWYQCYRKGASKNGIDLFANQKRSECLSRAHYINVSEKFFRCPFDEDAIQSEDNKRLAGLARQNVSGLLKAVTKTMIDKAQSHEVGMSDVELQQLHEEAWKDVIENVKPKGYYWVYSVHLGQTPGS